MLVICPTKSLAKKLKVQLPGVTIGPENFMWEWYANDFRFENSNLILFMNSQTYLPIVLKAAPYRDVVQRFEKELETFLAGLGFEAQMRNFPSEIVFSKTQDRSVLGVMNRFINDLSYFQYEVGLSANDTQSISLKLANELVGSKNYKTPLEMFAEKIGAPSPDRTALRLIRDV
jgi:hypothetical protein